MTIELRPVETDDLPIFFEHQQDAEAVQMAAFTAKNPDDREAFNEHWRKIMADDSVTICTITVDDEVVGHVLKYVMAGDPEVSYWIGREHWGKGIATRALQLFLKQVTVRPIYARVAKDNVGSLRVLQKCGFEIIATETGFANARQVDIEELVLRKA